MAARSLTLALALSAPLVHAAPPPLPSPERLARIGARMQAFVDAGKVAGVVTLVQHGGQRVHLAAHGYLNLKEKTALQADSIFEVMSMTKPVTAVAIVMLAEEGKLALTDPVEKHLPEFRGAQWVQEADGRQVKAARPITLRDLLTHSSGLPELPPAGMGGGQFYLRMDKTLAEAVTLYSQMPLLFQPGTRVQYSNPGIATLGRIVEVLSGQPYERFLAERIFAPLGMKDSFFFPAESHRARIARIYTIPPGGGKLTDPGYDVFRPGARYPMPEGGLYATAADMAAFYECFRLGGAPLISRAGHQTMLAIHSGDTMRGGTGWGLAWSVVQNNNGTLDLRSPGAYGHAGAFGTFGWVDPKRDLVAVLMIQGGAQDEIRAAFVEMVNAALP
ncbi:MAG: beta-lactamase family protein [Bryobacterales bacterium]|nr:beta-lactamase family protein [Bryobacterales bacterium]